MRVLAGLPDAGAIRAKLAIDQPGAEYEQEADRVAEQVTSMPESKLERDCACGGACPKCKTEEPALEPEGVQTKRTWSRYREQVSAPPIVYEVLRSPGRLLDTETRAFMEPRFGRDFSHVQVHTDTKAAESAQAVNALAYTVGQDVVFGAGQFSPGTASGRRLLAHELAHVVQQGDQAGNGTIQRTAATCPSGWSTAVRADHSRALGMIDTARSKLAAYDGTTPAVVKTALNRHFKASSSGFAGWVSANLWFLRNMARLASYDCEDTSSWWCSSGNTAKTFWCVPFVDIRVCQPAYFAHSDPERAETLIHEWVHKYGCNFDLGYSHEPDYPSQWTITALVNADPWSEFVQDVT
jgi:hypothetical protein